MTRTPSTSVRSRLRDTLRVQGPREDIQRRHLAVGARKINVGKTVGSFVPKLAQKSFEKYGFSTVALLTDWSVIVGRDLAQYTRPEKLKWPRLVAASADVEAGCEGRPGATLILRVEPARALDIEYGSGQIVERINSYFGYRAVSDIKILQMPLDAGARSTLHASGKLGPAAMVVSQPDTRSSSGADDPLAAVSDEKLRSSLQKLQAGLNRS